MQGLEDLDIQEDQNAVFVCEISVEDVPGEWYKNGERIQPTSTVKIRQEGICDDVFRFKTLLEYQNLCGYLLNSDFLFINFFRNKTFPSHV